LVVTVASGGTLDLNGFDQTIAGLANAGVVNMGTATASGTSGLKITNTGGSGDLTLGNGTPVVAGPYEYFLFRGGVTPGNENDWFLRNVAGPTPPGPEPVPFYPPRGSVAILSFLAQGKVSPAWVGRGPSVQRQAF
jgi:outer membrane autotransporter protein